MPTREQKKTVLFLVGTWAGIAALVYPILAEFIPQYHFRNIAIATLAPGIAIGIFWFLGRKSPWLFFHRAWLTIEGSSKLDLSVDVVRLVGLIGLISIPYTSHGINLFSLSHGTLFSVSLLSVVIAFIYPYIRVRTKWDDEYNKRKAMMATAMNYATVALEDVAKVAVGVRNIERSTLRAIKSYLEASVLDLYGNNLNVNLIVRNPDNPNQLVCIERSDPDKGVPTYYPVGTLRNVMKVFEERKPLYDGQFESQTVPPKPFKTVWLVPIGHPPGDETECMAVLAIDSKKRRHLDLKDERKALLFNLTPMIAFLRYSLVLRKKHNVWQ